MVPKRKLGNGGPLVSAIGYGAMGLEGYYGSSEEHDALATIQYQVRASRAESRRMQLQLRS